MRAHASPRAPAFALKRGDVVVAALIAIFAVLAIALHNSVTGLGDMAAGMRDTGTAIQRSGASTAGEVRRSVGETADALGGLPIVGGEAASRLRAAGDTTAAAVERETRADGARLVDAGTQGERDARSTARLIGLFAFLAPTVLLLAVWLPERRRRARARA